VACYLFGFLVAMPHYARAGVPIHAISAQTFIAAGLLFAVIATAIATAAHSARRLFRRRAADRRDFNLAVYFRRIGGVIAFVFPSMLVWQLAEGVPRPAVMVLALTFWCLLLPRYFSFPRAGGGWLTTIDDVLVFIVIVIPQLTTYALLVHPMCPARFGGGRPTALLAYPPGAEASLAKHDSWAQLSCRWKAGEEKLSPAGCRTIYKVHEGEQHLYLAIIEENKPCPTTPKEWKGWGWPRKSCYLRVPNASVERLEMWDRP
jgi:hypothetical protein